MCNAPLFAREKSKDVYLKRAVFVKRVKNDYNMEQACGFDGIQLDSDFLKINIVLSILENLICKFKYNNVMYGYTFTHAP